MKKKAQIYLKGRLLRDNEIVILRDSTNDAIAAVNLLNERGFDFRSVKQAVVLVEDTMELYFHLEQFTDKPLEIAVGELKISRSLRQNRFYWGVSVHGIIQEHKKHTGEIVTKERVHLDNLINIWGWKPEFETIFGREVMRFDNAPSSSKMTKEEFSQFIDKIISFYSTPVDGRSQVYELWQYIDEGDGTYNQYIKEYGKARY